MWRYLGLSLITCSMLLLQLYATRVFTVLFHSSFAFLAISLAFLGLGSAGVFTYVRAAWFPAERASQRVALFGLLYSLAVVGGFTVLLAVDAGLMEGLHGRHLGLSDSVKRVASAGVLLLPAFFCAGVVLSVLFRHHVRDINRLYFADLAGAGIGCLLVLPLLSWVGGDHAVFVIGALAAAGTVALAVTARARGIALIAALLVASFLALTVVNERTGIVRVRSYSTNTVDEKDQRQFEKAPKGDELYSAWNSYSRIGIFETHGGRNYYVRIDSSCQTSIPIRNDDTIAARSEEISFERLPYLLDRHDSYLEIGAGGGEGMLTAEMFGAKRIVGVEINDITVDGATRIFRDESRMYELFDRPNVDYVNDEGRSFVTQTDERFDTLTITFIQTGSASGATAFALSEANLFTVEAFEEFIGKLGDNGLFYVYRHGGNQMLRLISIMREVYHRRGIDDLKPHLFIAKDRELNHAVMMASLKPFGDDEIAKLERESRKMNLKVLYSPGPWNDAKAPNRLLEQVRSLRESGEYGWASLSRVYGEQHRSDDVQPIEHTYVHAADPDAFERDYFLDISATTDDRPYFFFFNLNRLSDLPMAFQGDAREFLGGIVVLLFYLMVGFTGLVVALILLPLLFSGAGSLRGGGRLAFLTYFAILGISYISIEVSFIQRFTLFLGHPIYAVSVVLMAFLVFTGVGSYFSDRLVAGGVVTLPRTLVVLIVWLLAYNWLLPAVFHSDLIGLAVPWKVVISTGLIFPLAFLMGILFPQGLRRVERKDADLVPWVWGANSATSVVGSIFSLILAIHAGFTAVVWFCVALYVLALIVLTHRAWRTA